MYAVGLAADNSRERLAQELARMQGTSLTAAGGMSALRATSPHFAQGTGFPNLASASATGNLSSSFATSLPSRLLLVPFILYRGFLHSFYFYFSMHVCFSKFPIEALD